MSLEANHKKETTWKNCQLWFTQNNVEEIKTYLIKSSNYNLSIDAVHQRGQSTSNKTPNRT